MRNTCDGYGSIEQPPQIFLVKSLPVAFGFALNHVCRRGSVQLRAWKNQIMLTLAGQPPVEDFPTLWTNTKQPLFVVVLLVSVAIFMVRGLQNPWFCGHVNHCRRHACSL